MLCLMRYITTEISTYNYMPCWIILFIEFLFYICCYILQSVRFVVKGISLTFSMLYFDKAWDAQSTASCCISSDMSAFFITAFLCSVIFCGFLDEINAYMSDVVLCLRSMRIFYVRLGLVLSSF